MEKIVFLDRDGTINEEVNYLHRTEDLKFLPGVPEALRLLKEAGFKINDDVRTLPELAKVIAKEVKR